MRHSPTAVVTAARAGLVGCRRCGLVTPRRPDPSACPRCGAALHPRKPDSLSRGWALLLAAMILYLPANLLPVMENVTLFGTSRDTILSGVVYFWVSGSPGLASLIFTVSIVIPLMKMAALMLLLLAAGRGRPRLRRQGMVLYRVVEFVGRWSMLDVFVVALMVALVRFQGLAEIDAGPGAAAFGAVVVLTMLAARGFDPRLIWDKDENRDD